MLVSSLAGQPVGSGSGVPAALTNAVNSNRWAAPAVANADDDEFDSATIAAAWKVYDTALALVTVVGGVDPYSSPAGAGTIRAQANSYRRSWLMMQPRFAGAGTTNYWTKPHTFPTNQFVYARFGAMTRFAAITQYDGVMQLKLAADNGAGKPDVLVNSVTMGWMAVPGVNTLGLRFSKTTASVFADVTVSTDQKPSTTPGPLWSVIALHKLGTTYHAWAGDDAGHWYYLGSTVCAFTVAHVCFEVGVTSATAPADIVFGVDFVRFINTATVLP